MQEFLELSPSGPTKEEPQTLRTQEFYPELIPEQPCLVWTQTLDSQKGRRRPVEAPLSGLKGELPTA